MEEGVRRNKGAIKPAIRSESTSHLLMLERRPLKTISLTPPDYKVSHHILCDSYLEKEVRFAGVVTNIPVHLDCTNRTDVLRVVDRGKREKLLPWMTNREDDAVISLNVQHVKLSKRDGAEELLLRLSIHEIAATCYIRDEDQHILAIKFGSYKLSQGLIMDDGQDLCQLAVLICDSRGCAEELCSLISQCFQLVYTDATMHFLDTKLSEAAAGLSVGSSTLRSDKSSANSTPKREHVLQPRLGFLSGSSQELSQVNGTLSSVTSRSLPRTMTRKSSTTHSESELSPTANEMIQEYMKKLYTKLNHDELRIFAMLVKAWHTNLAFGEFCDKVLELYGPERKYLLAGMRPFIPEKDTNGFETFLERIGLGSVSTWSDTISNNPTTRVYRSYTGASSVGNGDEFDDMLNEISHNIETLGTSVNMTLNLEAEASKTT